MIYNGIDITSTKYYQYATEVVNGQIVACKWTILACQRFLDMLYRPDITFNPKKVERVVRFTSKLKHTTGKTAGSSFVMEPWQEFVTAAIFGFWYEYTDPDNGRSEMRRLVNTAYIEMARKQGKTALIAAYAMYGLVYDHEAGSEIILAASSREQAGICFDMCKAFAASLDPHEKDLRVLRGGVIRYEKTNSKLKVIASDASKQDGFNAYYGIVDEYHSHKTSAIYDVIGSSQGFRSNPLMFVITTAGLSKDVPCYKMRQTNTEILSGIKHDDSRFCVIYTLDDGEDPHDETIWRKCAPNLGVTTERWKIRQDLKKADNDPTEMREVYTKKFNLWLDYGADQWIEDSVIEATSRKVDWTEFEGREVVLGADLAATSDLCAISFASLDEESKRFLTKIVYFLPEACLKKGPNMMRYRDMQREGILQITPGDTTDYDYITAFIKKTVDENGMYCTKVLYDRYNASQWAIDMEEAGFDMTPFSQTIGSFSPVTKQVEILIRKGQIILDSSSCTIWCFRNTTLKEDHNENVKPVKGSKDLKIDGVIALIESIGGIYAEYGNDYGVTKME